jgi:hypothetical protein
MIFRRYFYTIFIICVVLSEISCSKGRDEWITALQSLSNDDIKWDGDYIGLIPTVDGSHSRKLLEIKSDSIDRALIKDLDEDKKYVAAHVLLTLRHKISFARDERQWNGLHVTLDSTGKASYLAQDKKILFQAWSEWFASGKSANKLTFSLGQVNLPK